MTWWPTWTYSYAILFSRDIFKTFRFRLLKKFFLKTSLLKILLFLWNWFHPMNHALHKWSFPNIRLRFDTVDIMKNWKILRWRCVIVISKSYLMKSYLIFHYLLKKKVLKIKVFCHRIIWELTKLNICI